MKVWIVQDLYGDVVEVFDSGEKARDCVAGRMIWDGEMDDGDCLVNFDKIIEREVI